MFALGFTILGLGLIFAAGAWLMFSSLSPQPGQRTYCIRCGCDLTESEGQYCPKCLRLLSPEMRVTCSQSAIVWPRLVWGASIVAMVMIAAPLSLPPLYRASAASIPAATQPSH